MPDAKQAAAAISPKAKAALAAAKKLKQMKTAAGGSSPKPNGSSKKSTAKKASAKKANGAPRKSKHGDIPWGKIVQMWDQGKSSSEISDSLGFTDKKSNWPYSYTLGLIKRLKAGVEANGRKYKVTARRK